MKCSNCIYFEKGGDLKGWCQLHELFVSVDFKGCNQFKEKPEENTE